MESTLQNQDPPSAPAGQSVRKNGQFPDALWTAAALVLLVGAIACVAGTWMTFSPTFDEPYHIACGMQWLDRGTYTYEFQHPPLARATLALFPFLNGLRSQSQIHPMDEGNAILFSSGDPARNLAIARAGNLIFFALGALAVFLWARRWFSLPAAFWAVFLFVNLPPVLAHAGLATVDMACAATTALALYAFLRCTEDYTRRRLILAGAALGLAFACKFSSLAFLGACFLAAAAYALLRTGRFSAADVPLRRLPGRFAIVLGVTLLILWASYRFETRPIQTYLSDPQALQQKLANRPLLRSVVNTVIRIPVPLSSMVRGIYAVAHHNSIGHDAYLLGKFSTHGWWYFFPVVLVFKTPIGFLLLAGLGIFGIARDFRRRPWQQHLTVLFAAAILLVCMTSKINLGVRHILPIYPLLAVLGGAAISEWLTAARRRSPVFLAVPLLLAGWTVADSWMAHPDYLAYFNQFAAGHPEKILSDSDLDWGQDLYRLSARLKELHAPQVTLKYFGVFPLASAGLPPYTEALPDVPVTHGYLAVSLRYLTLTNAHDGSYSWLKDRKPTEIVGKSIYLYNLDESASRQ